MGQIHIDKVEDFKPLIAAAADHGFVETVLLFLHHGAEAQGTGAMPLAAEEAQTEMGEGVG